MGDGNLARIKELVVEARSVVQAFAALGESMSPPLPWSDLLDAIDCAAESKDLVGLRERMGKVANLITQEFLSAQGVAPTLEPVFLALNRQDN